MNIWIAGARPRTLPAAIAPVLIGTSLINIDNQAINWVNAALALAVGLLLQIAVLLDQEGHKIVIFCFLSYFMFVICIFQITTLLVSP